MTEAYLLDTNVISATRDTRQDPYVMTFLRPLASTDLYLSVITLGELTRGYAQKNEDSPFGAAKLGRWIDDVERAYGDRILGVDREIAKVWGRISSGRTRPFDDTLIAATAIVHGLTVVSRNSEDFCDLPVKLINPWDM